jgi:DNA-directed RNA polymerase subunit alpha
MIEIKRPQMTYLTGKNEDESKYGMFVIEPLERGYGQTIGNSMRRVLLGSLPGAAVTALRIDGVLHEFSTIPGVLEDVNEIILNVKELVVKLEGEDQVVARIEKKGSGIVTAADIVGPPSLTVIEPDHYIATINEDAKMEMELVIERGRGYIPGEKNQKKDQPFNTLGIDASFSPIKRVKYTVEDTRVGQDINYDKLVMELWTNGAIRPDEATCLAAQFIREHISLFVDYMDMRDKPVMVTEKVESANKNVDIPIKDVEFSVRSRNCLKRTNIQTIGELAMLSATELLEIKNFGVKSLTEIREKLQQYGLSLKDDSGGEGPK